MVRKMDEIKHGDQVKLLPPYQPITGLVSGTTYRDPILYQVDCSDGTRVPYVEATQLQKISQ
jgi:hypothetical protein